MSWKFDYPRGPSKLKRQGTKFSRWARPACSYHPAGCIAKCRPEYLSARIVISMVGFEAIEFCGVHLA